MVSTNDDGRAVFDKRLYKEYISHDKYTALTIKSLRNGIHAKNSQMIVGNPGLGKSALVNSLARNWLHYRVVTLIGSQMEPQDVTGFPRMVDKPLINGDKVSVTEYAIPVWQFEIMNQPETLLFLDEFSNSQPPVQAAMLQILNERRFANGMKIPDKTAIIGAMNPVETAADGYELTPPVANRLKFIPWEPNYKTWKFGLLCNWGEPNAISPDEMYWRRQITDFLDHNNSLVYKLPKGDTRGDPGSVYGFGVSPAENDIYKTAYPSNRSWTNLAKELPGCMIKNQLYFELALKTANGIVGYEAASKFMSFVRESKSRLPKTEDVLKNPNIVPFRQLDLNGLKSVIQNALDYAQKDGTSETATGLGELAIAYAEHKRDAYVAPYITSILKVARKSDDPKMAQKITAAYNEIGSIMR